jgi:hypothetical protein
MSRGFRPARQKPVRHLLPNFSQTVKKMFGRARGGTEFYEPKRADGLKLRVCARTPTHFVNVV